ncbi:uncharacterized protein LOC129808596 [Phlebotomus papatasi]|uniref:uncharacterized protein LOC129808596 n=1 Tax=Phlebotomus papatasi TaxID=29031 RepID=UPI00248348DF|nr:uncharacterized protein LOC129808596 [Phlebotomus papatasi]
MKFLPHTEEGKLKKYLGEEGKLKKTRSGRCLIKVFVACEFSAIFTRISSIQRKSILWRHLSNSRKTSVSGRISVKLWLPYWVPETPVELELGLQFQLCNHPASVISALKSLLGVPLEFSPIFRKVIKSGKEGGSNFQRGSFGYFQKLLGAVISTSRIAPHRKSIQDNTHLFYPCRKIYLINKSI